MKQIKYGQFRSEHDSREYENIHHFFVLLERGDFHVSAGFTNYRSSCHFSDVGIHFHMEDGDNCKYSPTGFCNCYDQVRWSSIDIKISDSIAVDILMERLEDALVKNGSFLSYDEMDEIRYELANYTIWEDEEN